MFSVVGDYLEAYGHINIRGLHRTTIEITKEKSLTPKGDCIIGVSSNKSVSELNDDIKRLLKDEKSILLILFVSDRSYDYVICRGSSELSLQNQEKIIIRKSKFIDESTLCIEANKSAFQIKRDLIEDLKKGGKLKVFLIGIRGM